MQKIDKARLVDLRSARDFARRRLEQLRMSPVSCVIAVSDVDLDIEMERAKRQWETAELEYQAAIDGALEG